MGSREGVAAKIETDTQVRIEEMNRAVTGHKDGIIYDLLDLVYDIKPEVHKNFLLRMREGQ